MTLSKLGQRGIMLFAVLLLSFTTVVATASPASAETKYYRFDNLDSWLCLDVVNWGSYEGANVQQWGCNWNWAQQWGINTSWGKWARDKDGGPYAFWVEIMNRAGNRCLAVADRSQANGANVHVEDCDAGPNQYWNIYTNGYGGTVSLRALHSNKCLDVYGFSKAYGGNVVQWDCYYAPQGANQRWYQRPAN